VVKLHAFLTSALDRSEWSASRFGRFNLGLTASCTLRIGGRFGFGIGPDAVAKRQKEGISLQIKSLDSTLDTQRNLLFHV
jgi:hypothetical protein